MQQRRHLSLALNTDYIREKLLTSNRIILNVNLLFGQFTSVRLNCMGLALRLLRVAVAIKKELIIRRPLEF